jgi:hypothetical protein
MITINEKTFDSGLWTLVTIIDGPNGTFVGPFIVELPEDATDEQLVAAIQAVL